MARFARVGSTLGCALLLVGCTPPASGHQDASTAPARRCSRFGETCEFAPGKLGTCVVREPCTSDDCFVCQSQH